MAHENKSNAESLREDKPTKVNFYRLLKKHKKVVVVVTKFNKQSFSSPNSVVLCNIWSPHSPTTRVTAPNTLTFSVILLNIYKLNKKQNRILKSMFNM